MLGVVVDEVVERRADHAGAHDLQPAGVLARAAALAAAELAAHVDLDARLREREEVRPHADVPVAAEERPGEVRDGALEVGQRDALVHHEALDLVEHRRVRRVGVAPVDLAGAQHVHRRALLLHDAHLDGRGVGAQQHAAVGVHDRFRHGLTLLDDPEGVVGGARGVARRRVERREVVIVELDLGTLGDAVAEADEDVLDLAHGLGDEVLVAGRERLAGQGDVDALVCQRGRERLALELDLALVYQHLEVLAHQVAALAHERTLRGRDAGDRAQVVGERALAAQDVDARLLQRGQVVRAQDGLAAALEDGREPGGS